MSDWMRPSNVFCFFFGAACGAAAMFLNDPEHGRRRRSMIRDKAKGLAHDAQEFADKHAHQLTNRVAGLVHQAQGALAGQGQGRQQGQQGGQGQQQGQQGQAQNQGAGKGNGRPQGQGNRMG